MLRAGWQAQRQGLQGCGQDLRGGLPLGSSEMSPEEQGQVQEKLHHLHDGLCHLRLDLPTPRDQTRSPPVLCKGNLLEGGMGSSM